MKGMYVIFHDTASKECGFIERRVYADTFLVRLLDYPSNESVIIRLDEKRDVSVFPSRECMEAAKAEIQKINEPTWDPAFPGASKLRAVVAWLDNRPEELNEGKSHLELIREFNNE